MSNSEIRIPSPDSSRDYRNALGRFATGITIVTTKLGDLTHGMTCNAFMSISLDPPLVAISVTEKAKMHGYLQASGAFGVSILSAEQESLSNHFAGRPQDAPVPFIDINGMPLIDGANVNLVTDIVQTHVIGDHTLFVGQVRAYRYGEDASALLYHAGKYASLD